MPTPYQSKHRLGVSPSSGDLLEQQQLGLSGRPLSGSHHTSSSSSLNQISDNELDNYESVSEYLIEPERKSSQQVGGSSGSEGSHRMSSASFNAPSYPAPLPPKKESTQDMKRKSRNSSLDVNKMDEVKEPEGGDNGGDEDDDDDDGYEPVKV